MDKSKPPQSKPKSATPDALESLGLFYEDLKPQIEAEEEPPLEPNPPIWSRNRKSKSRPKDNSLKRF